MRAMKGFKQLNKVKWQKIYKLTLQRQRREAINSYFTRVRIIIWMWICAFSLLIHLSSSVSREWKLFFLQK